MLLPAPRPPSRPPPPPDALQGSPLALVCGVLIMVSPFSAFAPTLEPVALALQRAVMRRGKAGQAGGGGAAPYPLRAALRVGLATACLAVAVSLPYVSDLMSLVGAVLTMSISLTIPALMGMRLLAGGPLHRAGCCAVILLGLACAAIGATSAAGSLAGKLGLLA